MQTTTKLYGVTLDCPDPKVLVDFYHQLTGMEITYRDDSFAGLGSDNGPAINFQRVEDYRAPEWPGQTVPQQFHLDFVVANLDEAENEVVALGAVKADPQPDGDSWRVFLDPAGHPFCLAAM